MSMRSAFLILILGIAIVLAAGCIQSAPAVPQEVTPPAVKETRTAPATPVLTMTSPVPPIPLPSTKGINLAYELELNGLDTGTYVPESVDVINPVTGTVLYTPDAKVFRRTYQPASDPLPTADERRTGTLRLSTPRISIWFKTDPTAVPEKLIHRLTLNRSALGLPPLTITGGEVTVNRRDTPVVIGSPVRGSAWVVMETTEPTTHHFLMPVTMFNRTTVDQRYAQDWFHIDPVTGNAATGNASFARNFTGYGKDLYAVADGTVVVARDGVPENEIIYHKIPFAFETGTGNTVVIDIGDGKYAGYCHLVPGSVKVTAGDRVKEGDIIGQLGNTGQSDVPHLHFEVVTGRPSIMGAEGYPFVFREFELVADGLSQNTMDEKAVGPEYEGDQAWAKLGDFVTFFSKPVPWKNKLQENWAIVRFP